MGGNNVMCGMNGIGGMNNMERINGMGNMSGMGTMNNFPQPLRNSQFDIHMTQNMMSMMINGGMGQN